MAAVFFVVSALAAIHAIVRYQVAYRGLLDSLPQQFRDDYLSSRYAFPAFVLNPSTPLALQAQYMQSLWGSCVFALFLSLGFFSFGNWVFGCFCLAGFSWALFFTIKSWKTYKYNRAMNLQDKEVL